MACDAQPASQAGGKMRTGRLEAFSDGVIAIIITIMVLEMKVPHGDGPNDLLPVLPVFLSYVLSFVYVGIYWNNHHHLLHATTTVTGAILWANLHLLFWLSLFPFATGWMGENHLGVATLERRSRRGRGGAGPVGCGIPSRHQSLLRDKWLGVERWPPPFARSNAFRSVPFDL